MSSVTESPSVPKPPQSDGAPHRNSWLVEWYVLILLAILVLLAIRASAAAKKIDDLGLDLIDRVRVEWKTVKCEEWPNRNGEYPCTGTFYVHAQAIRANKK